MRVVAAKLGSAQKPSRIYQLDLTVPVADTLHNTSTESLFLTLKHMNMQSLNSGIALITGANFGTYQVSVYASSHSWLSP